MSDQTTPVVITPGLGKGVRVSTREVPFSPDDIIDVAPGSPGIPDDVSKAPQSGLPQYIRDAISADLVDGLGRQVAEQLIREHCESLALVFGFPLSFLGDVLFDLSLEFDPARSE